MFKNVYYEAFYEKIDYFFHSPHPRPTNKPIYDPFMYFEISDVYGPEYMSSESNKTENLQTKLTLAIIIFIIYSIITLSIYLCVCVNYCNNNIMLVDSAQLVYTWILLYSYYRELKCHKLIL